MKLKDYKLDSSKESIEMTFLQAKGYLDDVKQLISSSNFDFFDSDEELTLEDARTKYNEMNRRLQTIGQAFELYIKYILLCSRLENNPSIKVEDLWGNWIRGHKIVELINKAEKLIPGFKNNFYAAYNAYHGFGNSEDEFFKNPSDNLFCELIAKYYDGDKALDNSDINKILVSNTGIYEKCRYNTESLTNYNFSEIWDFILFVEFFANMIHINNNSLNIDYNVTYTLARIQDKKIFKKILNYRTQEEINKIITNDTFLKDSDLMAYLLSHNDYSLDDVFQMMKCDKNCNKTYILFYFLIHNVTLSDIKKCKKNNINILLLTSGLSVEQLRKIIEIPIVGEYINKKPALMVNLAIKNEFYDGLTFDEWLDILNINEFKCNPQLLDSVLVSSKKLFNINNNIQIANEIFDLYPISVLKNKVPIDFSYIKRNILSNIRLLFSISIDSFPLLVDSNNSYRILQLLWHEKINNYPQEIFTIPFIEVVAVINYMKRHYIFNIESFSETFKTIYNTQCQFDINLKINKLSDEFIVENGGYKNCDTEYLNTCEQCMKVNFKSVFD